MFVSIHSGKNFLILGNSVEDSHHFDVDSDPAFYFDADPDLIFHSYADPDLDPTFQFDADPDPATHFSPDLHTPMFQNDPSTFSF